MSMPIRVDSWEWEQEGYIEEYGRKKLDSDLMEYEEITGKDWSNALTAFDSVSRRLDKFHKEVVLPLIRQTRLVTSTNN